MEYGSCRSLSKGMTDREGVDVEILRDRENFVFTCVKRDARSNGFPARQSCVPKFPSKVHVKCDENSLVIILRHSAFKLSCTLVRTHRYSNPMFQLSNSPFARTSLTHETCSSTCKSVFECGLNQLFDFSCRIKLNEVLQAY